MRRIGWLNNVVRAASATTTPTAAGQRPQVTYCALFAVFSLALLGFAIITSVVPDTI